MLRDCYTPMNLFDLVPALRVALDPVLTQLDHLLDDDTLFQAVKADLARRRPRTPIDHVVALARALKVTRGRKLRIDGTVVETNIHHPTDSTLLYDAVRVLSRTLVTTKSVVQNAVALTRHAFRDCTRSAKRQMKRIMEAARQRGTAAADRMHTAYQHLLDVTQATVQQAQRVGAILQVHTTPASQKLRDTLDYVIPLVQQVIGQTTRRVLQGEAVPAPEKLVSLFEPHTAIIRKGKPGKATEFGRVLWLDEVKGSIISRYTVLDGNPAQDAQLPPSLDHHVRMFKRPPRLLAGDRGVPTTANEQFRGRGGSLPPFPRPR